MKQIIVLLAISMLFITGMASAENYIAKPTTNMVNLSGKNLSEFDSILFEGKTLFLDKPMLTSSQRAISAFDEADGKPIGQTMKPVLLGNLWKNKVAVQKALEKTLIVTATNATNSTQ